MALVEKLMMCPFDMVVLDKLSRFHLAMDALKYVPRSRSQVSDVIDMFNRKRYEHHVKQVSSGSVNLQCLHFGEWRKGRSSNLCECERRVARLKRCLISSVAPPARSATSGVASAIDSARACARPNIVARAFPRKCH